MSLSSSRLSSSLSSSSDDGEKYHDALDELFDIENKNLGEKKISSNKNKSVKSNSNPNSGTDTDVIISDGDNNYSDDIKDDEKTPKLKPIETTTDNSNNNNKNVGDKVVSRKRKQRKHTPTKGFKIIAKKRKKIASKYIPRTTIDAITREFIEKITKDYDIDNKRIQKKAIDLIHGEAVNFAIEFNSLVAQNCEFDRILGPTKTQIDKAKLEIFRNAGFISTPHNQNFLDRYSILPNKSIVKIVCDRPGAYRKLNKNGLIDDETKKEITIQRKKIRNNKRRSQRKIKNDNKKLSSSKK